MKPWRIEPFSRAHDRSAFSCGKSALDQFLQQRVSQYQKRNLGRTYVAVRPGEPRVWGYYTLASGSLSFENLPPEVARKLPNHPIPVVLLGRLAIDQIVQGQGLGGLLLLDALQRSAQLAGSLGLHAVEVQAIDDEARRFYEHYGFSPLLTDQRRLYLPIATIRSLSHENEKS